MGNYISRIKISGIVQGVGFRPFVFRVAKKSGLNGYVRNLSDAGVEIAVEGSKTEIKKFLEVLTNEKPENARIDKIDVQFEESKKNLDGFEITGSGGSGLGGIVPPDISVCGNCVNEIFDKNNRRYEYPFTACTNCGPRFTTISKIPYDRINTAFRKFKVCRDCEMEYANPSDRRFRAEIISCPECGPGYFLADKKNSQSEFLGPISLPEKFLSGIFGPIEPNPKFRKNLGPIRAVGSDSGGSIWKANLGPISDKVANSGRKGREISDPIKNAIKFLDKGKILCIKGIGGMHIACNAVDDNSVKRLRKRLKRPQQPFAVMCSDLAMVEEFADIDDNEKKVLMSKERPIVVVKKSRNFRLSGFVSPGLDNIGIMLPYTALHSILFNKIKKPLVMTSANIPGEPMLTGNEDSLKIKFADFFLLNNLEIENRCDDSVVKFVNDKGTFIRRSRGFVPLPIYCRNSDINVLSVGAELNVTACLLIRNSREFRSYDFPKENHIIRKQSFRSYDFAKQNHIKGNSAFLSQHIGNVKSPNTIKFLKESIDHMLRITNSKPDVIACDLHPDFHTTKIAEEFSEKFNVPLIRIQHHYAHLSSLAEEHNLDEIAGICCDGLGYGTDGNMWGGEIIVYKNKKFERVGHLKEQRMPGGDIAVYYPARMVAGILYDFYDPKELKRILIENRLFFKYGKGEIDVIIKQLQDNINTQKTTSAGRILDAISSLLGICSYRSYEGEPAMKLESAGNNGTELIDFPISIKNNILDTTKILQRVLQLKEENYKIQDIALSAEIAVAKGLAGIAIRTAKKKGIRRIGITGGVAYNDTIVRRIADEVRRNRIQFIQHEMVPCGDGGISFGQAMCAAQRSS